MPHPVSSLVSAVRAYLLGLPGPGIADVISGIDRCDLSGIGEGPGNLVPAVSSLDAALAAIRGANPLRDAIAAARTHFAWQRYLSYPMADIGPKFPEGHGYVTLIGGDAPVRAEDFELGLFLIAPRLLYRDHRHAAPELYVPLTGPHRWRFGADTPWTAKPAHVPVWNEAWDVHATISGDLPFLCVYAWTRDVNVPAQVVSASDWDVIEATL